MTLFSVRRKTQRVLVLVVCPEKRRDTVVVVKHENHARASRVRPRSSAWHSNKSRSIRGILMLEKVPFHDRGRGRADSP